MTLVTHLECSLTGERYEAGEVHNLGRAGKPLLVRYDMAAARRTLTRDSIAARQPGMWKWRELLPNAGEPVSLGEIETPIVPLPRTGGAKLLVKDEGRLPTGSFKARGLAMAVTMAKELGIQRIAMPTNGNAGAALAAYGAAAGIETIVVCPAETPAINVTETALTAHLVAPDAVSTDQLLQAARNMLHDRFGIEHCTLQIERTHLKDTRCS